MGLGPHFKTTQGLLKISISRKFDFREENNEIFNPYVAFHSTVSNKIDSAL